MAIDDKDLSEIKRIFEQRINSYDEILVKTALVKENGVWKSKIMLILPTNTHGADNRKLDYGDFVILEHHVHKEDFSDLVNSILKENHAEIGDCRVEFDSDSSLQPLFSYSWGDNFVSSHGSGDIERFGFDWPSKAFIYGSMNSTLSPFPIQMWLRKGVPAYPNIQSAIENEFPIIGFTSAWYWFGKVLFILPDYRARFTKIKISQHSVTVYLEFPQEYSGKLFVKYLNQSQLGYENPGAEIEVKGNFLDIPLEDPPLVFYCFLLDEAFQIIDIIRYDENYGYFSRNWIEYGDATYQIEYLASRGESQNLEYKREIGKDKKEFLESVVAFANSNGGTILVGVSDHGDIVGCGNTSKEQIEQSIRDSIKQFVECEISEDKYDGKPVIMIRVPDGYDKPYYLLLGNKSVPYIRRNSSDMPMSPYEIEEIYRQKYEKPGGPFG